MKKVYYICKSFFESSSKFENRVNSILKDIADNNTIDSVSWNNKAIMVTQYNYTFISKVVDNQCSNRSINVL